MVKAETLYGIHVNFAGSEFVGIITWCFSQAAGKELRPELQLD